jgi:Uma2 family endonuclease
MSAISTKALRRPRPAPSIAAHRTMAKAVPAALESGDRLTAPEFLRRYEADPTLQKAQLIEGIVLMPSPVRAKSHAEPDSLLQFWLGCYAMLEPSSRTYVNPTLVLNAENALQPDAVLCSTPQKGGAVWLNEKGYLCGTPELVCEIAASSASIDLHDKLRAYRRQGIPEYLVWLPDEAAIRWFELRDGDYVAKAPEKGRLSSNIWPGLILNIAALLSGDRAAVLAELQRAAHHREKRPGKKKR